MGFFVFIILLILGFISVIDPATAWRLTQGWQFKDAEPSDAALKYLRVVGVIEIIAGFYFLFTM